MAINWQEEQRRIKEEGKNRVNTTYDSAADVINKNRDSLIAQAGAQRDTTLATQKQEYQGLHDQAAAQEIVNRRRTGEAMANAGLTDSGLNRTQQTAITLARGNQDAALTRQQQDARDAINLAYDEMVLQAQNEAAQQLTANEKERNEYLAAVEEMYGENIAAGIAAEAEAKAAVIKQQQDILDTVNKNRQALIDLLLTTGQADYATAVKYAEQMYPSDGSVGTYTPISTGGTAIQTPLGTIGSNIYGPIQAVGLKTTPNSNTVAAIPIATADIKANVDTLKLKVKNGQMTEEDMLDTLAYGTYANDESKLRQALAYMGYSTPEIEAMILEVKG